jgi:hypothetical protein
MTQRNPSPEPPVLQHTRDWHLRLNELRHSHPHLPLHELVHFLNHPPSLDEAPAKPTPAEPKERTQAQKIWPHLP